MPGNSQRKNKRTVSRKGPTVGSGGKRKQGLAGRGKTLPAGDRPWHKEYDGPDKPKKTQRKQANEARKQEERRAEAGGGSEPRGSGSAASRGGSARGAGTSAPRGGSARGAGTSGTSGGGYPRRPPQSGSAKSGGRGSAGPRRPDSRTNAASNPVRVPSGGELIFGRNPVVESLRAHMPATTLYVALQMELDDRVTESIKTANNRGIAIVEIARADLDRAADGVPHQGLALAVPEFPYESFEDLLASAKERTPLLVALDGVTDPRNLGAVIRSAAAFGAQGVFLPQRRAAPLTAAAWRTSAGAAARQPVARVPNLTRALERCKRDGLLVAGLAADGDVSLYDLEAAIEPIVLVVGAEGRGLSRLVDEACDLRVSIPIDSNVESLNASVAASVALAEISRRRALSA